MGGNVSERNFSPGSFLQKQQAFYYRQILKIIIYYSGYLCSTSLRFGAKSVFFLGIRNVHFCTIYFRYPTRRVASFCSARSVIYKCHRKSKRYTTKAKDTAKGNGPRQKQITQGKAYAKATPHWQKAHTYSKHWQQGQQKQKTHGKNKSFANLEALSFRQLSELYL